MQVETQRAMSYTSSDGFASFAEYYRNGPLSHFDQEHRGGGSFAISMFQVDQAPAEFYDPPLDEIMFVGFRGERTTAEIDFGDGWSRPMTSYRSFFGIQPPRQACGFRIHDASQLIVVSAASSTVFRHLDEIGIRGDALCALYGRFDFRPEVLACMTGIWKALEQGGPANNLLVDGYFLTMIGHLLRTEDLSQALPVPDLDDPALSRCLDYIEAGFDAPLSTAELASVAGLSVAQFGRAFKDATGLTPHRYLTVRRVAHAKRMLSQTRMSLTRIAFACGFSSAAHFSTVFRRMTGATPSAWRAGR